MPTPAAIALTISAVPVLICIAGLIDVVVGAVTSRIRRGRSH